MRRLAAIGALFFFAVIARPAQSQVIERPVAFDTGGLVTVMTPFIAAQAGLRPPWWPVSGEFSEARMFTTNDSTFVLAVTRRTGVVERYSITALDRDAIRATVSKLPREVLARRGGDARNAFIRGQTILGLLLYAPAFSAAISEQNAGIAAGYLVVAGGTFFAASEISRRMSITRAQTDLAFNMGHNIGFAGSALMYLFGANDRAQAAGAFVGGLSGVALGLGIGRGMSESDANGAAFGSDVGALIGLGIALALRGESSCQFAPQTQSPVCKGPRLSDKAVTAIALGSGLIGYPLGLLYPRNAVYNVTPGDIQTLWPSIGVGVLTGAALLKDSPSEGAVAAVLTTGGILGIVLGDRLFVRPSDHSRADGGRVTLGAFAGGLMGAGVAALTNTSDPNTHLVFGLAAAGMLAGSIAADRYVQPDPDARNPRLRVTFNPASIALIAARASGNHSLINVRF